jgi:NADH pyrophosphatase NudC (nudix superfamily)
MNLSPRPNGQNATDEQLNAVDPSPEVKRFEALNASCPKCGLGLYISRRGVIVACGNGHTYTYPDMQYQGGF